MALARVYCGLASADLNAAAPGSATWLTVAVVDDSGRLLDICDVSDDAAGFAELGGLLAERSTGLESVAVAADSDDHIVTQLLTAAGRYLAYTDEDSADDYAERFGDDESADEIQAGPTERRAVGLARALQAGVLSAVAQATPRDLLGLKPVLAAHAAVTNGRQGAAATLREVLRELYPAALRAFPDPAEAIPLAVLDALPEPGPLGSGANGRGRDAQAIAELTEAGVADNATVTEAVTALRVAIAETPRRTGMNRSITSAVAETVRQAVAAVRACDAAALALVSVLAARMPSASAPAGAIRQRGAAAEPAPLRAVADETTRNRRARIQSAAVRPRSGPPAVRPQSAPPAPVATPPAAAQHDPVRPAATPPAAAAAAAANVAAASTVAAAVAGAHRRRRAEEAPAQPAAHTPAPVAPTHPPVISGAHPPVQPQVVEQQPVLPAPIPVQTPAAPPVPVYTAGPAPVPVQSPPPPIPVPAPASMPLPVHPAPNAHTGLPAYPGAPGPAAGPWSGPQAGQQGGPQAGRQADQLDSQRGGQLAGQQSGHAAPRLDAPPEQPRSRSSVAAGPPPGLTPAYTTPAVRPAPPAEQRYESLIPSPATAPPISGPPVSAPAGPRGGAERFGEAAATLADQQQPASGVTGPSRAWPLVGEAMQQASRVRRGAQPHTYGTPVPTPDQTGDLPLQRDGRIVPPWQSDDLPVEPPSLRLVEPAPWPTRPCRCRAPNRCRHGSRHRPCRSSPSPPRSVNRGTGPRTNVSPSASRATATRSRNCGSTSVRCGWSTGAATAPPTRTGSRGGCRSPTPRRRRPWRRHVRPRSPRPAPRHPSTAIC